MSRWQPDRGAVIEAFRPEHTDELLLMWRESFEHGVGVVDPHPLAEQRNYLLDAVVPHNTTCVAILEGRIVGFVAATPSSIAQLYVRNGFHRRGIGALLLTWAKERSNGSLWLHTFEQNAVARAFYEKNGFRIVERGFEPLWQLPDLKYQWDRPG